MVVLIEARSWFQDDSHHQLVEISTVPLGSFTRKESHTDVEVLFGGILAWEFSDVFGGIFTIV